MNNTKLHNNTSTTTVFFLAMICGLLWGSAFPGTKINYQLLNITADDIPTQILLAGIRFTLAGTIAIIIGSIINKKFLIPHKSSLKKIAVLSFFQTITQYILVYIGLAHTTGVKSSIIIGSNVFTAILISSLIFKLEKLTFPKIIGCIIGFAGIIVINFSGLSEGFSFNFLGDFMMLLSTVCYSLSSVTMKKYCKGENTSLLSGYQFLFGGIVLVIIGLVFGGRITVFNAGGVALLIYLSFVSAVAYTLWAFLLKYNPVSRVAVFGFMNPVFGVILSSIFLKEKGGSSVITTIIALVCISSGIYIVNKFTKID